MIDSIFITVLLIAFILVILSIEKKSIVYSALGLITWVVIFAQSFFIEVPGIEDFSDYTLNAVSLAFIFVEIIWVIALLMEGSINRRFRT